MNLLNNRPVLRKLIRVLTWISLLLLVLLVVLEVAFLLNRDNIRAYIISSVNREIAGKIVAASVGFSPLYNFPHLSVRLNDVELYEHKEALTGANEQAFCKMGRVFIGLDLAGLLHGRIDVSEFAAEEGRLGITKRDDGSVNLMNFFMPAKDSAGAASGRDHPTAEFSLNRIRFKDIRVIYADSSSDYRLDMEINEFENNLTLHKQQLNLRLNPQIGILDIEHAGSSFLKDTRLELAADVNVDLDSLTGRINNGSVNIEGARLNITGDFAFRDTVRVDLHFASSVNDPSLLRLLFNEEAIEQNLKNIARGSIYCDGRIEGRLAGGIPFIEIEFGVKNLTIKVPDTDRVIKDFGFEGYFTTGHQQDLSDGLLSIGKIRSSGRAGPSSGDIRVRNFHQPEINMHLNAVIDLTNIDRAVRFIHVPLYSGVMNIKANVDAKLDNKWENIQKKTGSVDIGLKDCSFLLKNTGKVLRIPDGTVSWQKEILSVRGLRLEAPGNRWLFNGTCANFTKHLMGFDSEVHLDMNLQADSLEFKSFLTRDDAGEWILDEYCRNVVVDLAFDSDSRKLREDSDLPPGNVIFRKVRMDLKNVSSVDIAGGTVVISPDMLDLRNIRARIAKNNVLFSGKIRNYADLFANDFRDSCRISLDLTSGHLWLKDIFTYKGINYLPGFWAETEYDDIGISADLTLPADADTQSVKPYDFKLHLRNLNGVNSRTGKKINRLGLWAKQKGDDLILENINGRIGGTTMDNTSLDIKDLFSDDRDLRLELKLNCDSLNIGEWLISESETGKPSSVTQGVPPDSGSRVNETMIPVMNVSGVIGKIIYDKNYMKNFRISAKTNKENRFISDQMDSTWWIPEIDLTATIESDTFRTEYFKVPDAHDRITVTNGSIEILPSHTGISGSKGTGLVRIDLSQKIHRYALSYTLNNYNIETLLKRLRQREHMSGRIDMSMDLKMTGEHLTGMEGGISVSGKDLTVYNLDIDELLKRFKRTQNFNLVDVGAFMIAGPAGTMITKASDYVFLLELDPSKKSRIHDFLSSWTIQNGRLMADDVALTTDQSRIALKGGIDFNRDEFEDFTIAVVDKNGCPLISQKITGSIFAPKLEKINVVSTVLAPVTNVLKKIGGLDCTPFYTGSVPPPGE
jgi:hypothetical protein